jgi:hypothetical protein
MAFEEPLVPGSQSFSQVITSVASDHVADACLWERFGIASLDMAGDLLVPARVYNILLCTHTTRVAPKSTKEG